MKSGKLMLLTILCVFLSSCGRPTPITSPLTTSPLATPVPQLSEGTTILEKETPWSTPSQQAVVFRNKSQQLEFRVMSSDRMLVDFTVPDDEVFEDVVFAGDTSDVAKVIGLITKVGNDGYKGRVYNVNLGAFVPNGSTGETSFFSTRVPPFLSDLDNDTIPELVVAFDDPGLPSGFVNNRIYVLSGGAYVESNFLILPPRELISSK